MKKALCFILTLIFALVPLTASAQETDITKIMMGDLNSDGKINAMDARSALRYAAKLDDPTGIPMLSIDADGDGKISASDARIILRVSAKLSQFVFGFDGKGNANAIKTIQSKVYSLNIENYDEQQKTTMSFFVARDNDDAYMLSDDQKMLNNMGMSGLMQITKCGMMVKNNEIYALLGTAQSDIAMYINQQLQEEMDVDAEMVYEIVNMISDFVPADLGTPVTTTLNGKEVLCYSYSVDGQQCQLFINASNGQLTHIDGILKNGDAETMITFKDISGDKPTAYFDLNSFDEIW